MRAALFTLRLARARLVRRRGPFVLAALGIAAGAAVLTAVLGGSSIAQDRSVAQAVERIPSTARSVRGVWFGVPAAADERYAALDRSVRSALEELPLGAPTPLVLFRESTLGGRFAGIAAVDRVAPWVLLRSGRLPRTCRPSRCEVLRLRGKGPIPNAPGLRLVEVGRASLRSRLLFGDFIAPTDNALARAQLAPALQRAVGYHQPPPPPLLLAQGVSGLVASPQLDRAYRSYAWVWPLRAGRPRLWQVDSVAAAVDRGRARLKAQSFAFDVAAPVEELRAAQRSSRVAGRRLLLVGGEAAALLFAFAILAAASMRRDLGAARDRLRLYGARRWQLALLTLAESAAVGVAGTALGWLAGAGAAALAAQRAGAPVGSVLRESVVSPAGLLLVAGAVLAASAVLALAVTLTPRGRALDAAALAALAVVAAALAGGAADRDRLATSESAGAVLVLLPGLIAFAAAVAAARLLAPALRLAERHVRSHVGARLAALSLSRGPGTALVAAAFLVVSFSLALLAEGYRATLARSERDTAAFQVPLDFVVREDLQRLVPVQDAASLERFAALGPDVGVVPVLRLTGSAGRLEGITGVTVLGLPPAALPELRGLGGGATLARRIDAGAPRVRGLDLERGARTLELSARGGPARLFAAVLTPRGDVRELDLGVTTARPSVLRASIPADARGGRLVALDFEPATRLQERGADAGRAQRIVVSLREPNGAAGALDAWIGTGGAAVSRTPGGIDVSALLTPERTARIRPRQPTDDRPPAVLVTPGLARVAGPGGTLPVEAGGAEIAVRVAGTVPRFPGATGEVAVGDVDALVTALTAARPGAARVGEVWLSVSSDAGARRVAAELSRPPFRALQTVSRRAIETDEREDPLAHGTLLTLVAAALVALALAVLGILLSVTADLRDERGELLELEADGATPSLLRRVVRLRALAVAAFGLAAGTLAGAGLTALVTDLVTVTARATAPEPPLVLTLDPLVIAAAGLAYAALAVGLVVLATHRAFAGRTAL